MRVDLFDFDLPQRCIADKPVVPRDSARLLVAGDPLQDKCVHDLPEFLTPGDILVFNDTKVIPARLKGRRGLAKIELMLHRRMDANTWRAFARPAKRLKEGDEVAFAEGFSAHITHKFPEGEVECRFACPPQQFMALLVKHGEMPLPPYIPRPDGATLQDSRDYQTAYAKYEGAVAAPTAGLHFTPELLTRLEAKGIRQAFVTLHVGAGTFLPVKAEDTKDHKMHREYGVISREAAENINAAKASGGRVVAVGTTSLRLLESAANSDGTFRPFAGETDIFITPGYRFKAVELLMTNFHLPRSTLLMLVSAFAGMKRIKAIYAHAIESGYRFYSYGDACLLYKNPEAEKL